MIFSSIPFLYYFLPMVLLLYYIVPKRCKNGALLLSSLVFYAWGEPKAVIVMIVSIMTSYLCGRLIGFYKRKKSRWSRLFFVLGTGISLSFLLYFKYMGFFVSNISAVTGISIPIAKVALPVGISFYTFQLVSYLADVYRGTVSEQRNIIDLAAYVVMFPQLIAGPIVRYADIALQLKQRRHSFTQMAQGIQRFVIGMSKKVLIADALGKLCSHFQNTSDQSVLFIWLYGVAFMLQIYFDFSGYSDMAIGLGKMFGFTFMENFDYPYISRSITEFWRRWHISLGSWFRDYVYIPLGGNRVSKKRWLFNILVVWMLTGFWHGAAWNFILWGLYFAVLLLIEKMWLHTFLEKHKIFAHIYVLLLVLFGFIMFNAPSVIVGLTQIGNMFGYKLPLISAESCYYLNSYGVVLILAMVGATPLPKRVYEILKSNVQSVKRPMCAVIVSYVEMLACIGLLLLMTAYFVDGSFSPFLYFRF